MAAADAVRGWQMEAPAIFGDIKDLLGGIDCDAVDICAPHYLHHELGVRCLQAGLYVQIEKPIGITVKATLLLIDAAARADRYLATAENIGREPGPRTANWLINSRKLLGKMQSIFVQEVRSPRQNVGIDDSKMKKTLPQWVWRDDRLLEDKYWTVVPTSATQCAISLVTCKVSMVG